MCDRLTDEVRDDDEEMWTHHAQTQLVAKHFLLCGEEPPKFSSPNEANFTVSRSHTNVLSWYCVLIIVITGIVVKLVVRTLADVLDRIIDV